MKGFNLIWIGQLISLVGATTTQFGLGVWVFETTGSATAYATLMLVTSLPGLLVLPLAGALVDRWDRRRTMIFSDAGAALAPAVTLVLVLTGSLQLWHVYALVSLSAVFSAFQWPAFSALLPEIVPKEGLSRANSRIGVADGVGPMLGAVLGGALYGIAGPGGLLAINVLTYAVALATLAGAARLVTLPRRAAATTASGQGTAGLLRDMGEGWTYVRHRPGLMHLLLLFACANFTLGVVTALVPPLVLSVSTPAVLGAVEAIGAAGMLAGGVWLSVRPGPSRRVAAIIAITLGHGVLVVVCGLLPSLWVIAPAWAGILFGRTVITALSATLWQLKTPIEVQGRVYAVRRVVAWSMAPIAYALAGPLVDQVARPLVGTGRPAAPYALVFVAMGVITLVAAVVGRLRPRLRHVETELPDVLPDSPYSRPPSSAPKDLEIPMSSTTATTDTARYAVVLNHEEQYSTWPADRALPAGWHEEGTRGTKDECLDHIGRVWTDVRPLSVRRRAAAAAAPAPAGTRGTAR